MAGPFRSEVGPPSLRVETRRPPLQSAPKTQAFRAACPPDKKVKVQDLLAFRRGRGDLWLSGALAAAALFFLAAFFTQTGWQDRDLPEDLLTYFGRQLGLIEGEGRLERFGKILKQGWVAPLLCLAILVPAAALNLSASLRTHRWRRRFGQPVEMRHEGEIWVRALEFVVWFIAYTALVPVLGYLLATLILGVALPWRLGYRGGRWLAVTAGTSLTIVLVFRSALQIKTPVNIWLYERLPQSAESFMKTWF